jgi:uncharacterized protein YjbI with pentapeptide repeats
MVRIFMSDSNLERDAASQIAGSAAAPSPAKKDELELEQLRLSNRKLKIEADKLEDDSKPESSWSKLIKNAVAFGGVVTIAASLYGIWDSYDKTIIDRDKARLADRRTRIEDAIKRLESSSTISKLVGVSVLGGYLDNQNKDAHRQVLFTFAVLMATEKDPQTQVAVIDLVDSIPKDGPIAPADWHYFQDTLLTQSRALVLKGDLTHHRQFGPASPLTDDERAARTVGKLIASNIRKGVVAEQTNYRGIYCEECDFHGAVFPQRADFTGAILDHANFSGAKLAAAVFDNAELSGSKFVETDLQQAKFRSLDDGSTSGTDVKADHLSYGRTAYIDHIASALDVNPIIEIRMPNFSCANLADADFDHHALFPGVIPLQRSYSKGDENKPGWHHNVPAWLRESANPTKTFSPARIWPPKFSKANLERTHLEKTAFFYLSDTNDPFSDYMGSSTGIRATDDVAVMLGQMAAIAFLRDQKAQGGRTEMVIRDIGLFQARLGGAFYLAGLEKPFLSDDVAGYLKNSPPTLGDFLHAFHTPFDSEPDPDLNCTPRR